MTQSPTPATRLEQALGWGQAEAGPDDARAAEQPAPGAQRERTGLPLAARWRRLAGFVVDALILTLLTGALWGRLIASFANRLSVPGAQAGHVLSQTAGPFLIELCFTICVAVLYYWLLTAYWGTTIGKRWFGAWVVLARDQSRVSMGAAFLRAVIFVLGGEVIAPFFLVDNLWLLWDRRRQCLHDKAARTIVVTTAVSRRSSTGRRRLPEPQRRPGPHSGQEPRERPGHCARSRAGRRR